MIKCYTGTPGSGKSLHSIRLICLWLKEGLNVISNFPLKINEVEKNNGHYYYIPNEEMTVPVLMQFAKTMHEERKEHQTLIVVDEASVKFNSRTFMEADRLDFLSFFAQHRHYGYEIVLICQNMKQIDRQIRDLVEIEVIHRNAKNYWLYRWLPFALFISVEKNVVMKDKNNDEFFLYSKYYGSLYDTFYEFNKSIDIAPTEDIQAFILDSEQKTSDRTVRQLSPLSGRGTLGGPPRQGDDWRTEMADGLFYEDIIDELFGDD